MIVLLPTAADGLPKLEKAWRAEKLATLTRTLLNEDGDASAGPLLSGPAVGLAPCRRSFARRL